MNNVAFAGKLGQRLYQAAQNLQEKTNDYQEAKKLDDKMNLGIIDAEDTRLIAKTKDILKDVSAKLNPGQPQEDTVSFSKPKPETSSDFIALGDNVEVVDDDNDPYGGGLFGAGYTPGTKYAVFSSADIVY